jgi:hypothetical protein
VSAFLTACKGGGILAGAREPWNERQVGAQYPAIHCNHGALLVYFRGLAMNMEPGGAHRVGHLASGPGSKDRRSWPTTCRPDDLTVQEAPQRGAASLISTGRSRITEPQQAQGLRRTITNTSLPDIIQLLCIGRNSCRVHVRSGPKRGLICFRQGEIVHAETGSIEGEEAFYQILSWELGSFDSDQEAPRAETIQESWDFLLMESMRRLDKTG